MNDRIIYTYYLSDNGYTLARAINDRDRDLYNKVFQCCKNMLSSCS